MGPPESSPAAVPEAKAVYAEVLWLVCEVAGSRWPGRVYASRWEDIVRIAGFLWERSGGSGRDGCRIVSDVRDTERWVGYDTEFQRAKVISRYGN